MDPGRIRAVPARVRAVARSARSLYPDLHECCTPSGLRPSVSAPGVWLKDETCNPAGSFKVRSAAGALAVLRGDMAAAIVLTSGNFGIAMAHLGRELPGPVAVVIPRSCAARKREMLAALGARVIEAGADGDAGATEHAHRLGAARGLRIITPYGPPAVLGLAGVSIMDEILAEGAGFESVYAPCGGGGLLAGLAAVLPESCELVCVETENSPGMDLSFRASAPVTAIPHRPTVADAVEGGVDAAAYRVLRSCTRLRFLRVGESQVRAALERLEAELGHPVEGAGALAFAGRLNDPARRSRACVLVTGRNA